MCAASSRARGVGYGSGELVGGGIAGGRVR